MFNIFEEVEYLTQIIYEGTPTYYFFHKKSKTLIPVNVDSVNSLRLCDKHPSQPDTAETYKKLILAMGVKVQSIKVYLYQNNNYYTYVSVKGTGEEIDINASFIDAISLAKILGSPILFAKDIIKNCGFRITKKMIEKALLS